MLPEKLQKKLNDRKQNNTFRRLETESDLIDFSSNDYLGFATNNILKEKAKEVMSGLSLVKNGATGSRLLSGNHELYDQLEQLLVQFHNCEAALVFNSGYDANLGCLQSIPQRGDIILYDEWVHASIRDGITISHAKAHKFSHNNIEDLRQQLSVRAQSRTTDQELFVVTESVFSMDGDCPDLKAMSAICKTYNAYLIVDEAHAIGVLGNKGQGLVQALGLEKEVFARVVTFGKALGAHGAAVLGSQALRNYLVNFARSFIYTTALPPHTIASIIAGYTLLLESGSTQYKELQQHIDTFNQWVIQLHLESYFIKSDSAIMSMIIPGNKQVKTLSRKLQQAGYDVKPILSPTVPEGKERLRFCIHSFNTEKEIKSVLSLVSNFLRNDTVA